jgi:hypothetical protein
LLVLSALALAIFNSGKSSDRMRSGARTAQSAFLGAKDRALHAKDLRGVRLTRDATNLNLINGFVYLQPLPLQSAGNTGGAVPNDFSIQRPGLTKTPPFDDATQIDINGKEGLAFYNQDSAGFWPPVSLQIRIPSKTGEWFQLARQNTAPPYWMIPDPNNPGNYLMYLQTGYPGGVAPPAPIAVGSFGTNGVAGDPNASCDIHLGNDLLPFHQPITLPSGCVIDLNFCNAGVQTLAGYKSGGAIPTPVPNIDIMFSPRGSVTGTVAALGTLFFCLRDMRDATKGLNPADPKLQGDQLILGVFPQTGLVQTFEVDPIDVITNATGQPPADGLADNIFSFAQRGQSAGR